MKCRAFLIAGVLLAAARMPSLAAEGAKADADLVRRGEYLVNRVAQCGECHTPRDARGQLDLGRHLQGAKMWFTPRVRAGEWEDHAPDITGGGKGGKWTEERLLRLLTGAKKTDPPMPPYAFSPEDARAAAAYLRSLPGKKDGNRNERERRERRERNKKREREREND
jgi:mono/diheme cytochrome c family protein